MRPQKGVYQVARRRVSTVTANKEKINIITREGSQLGEVNENVNGGVFSFFFLSSAMMKLKNTPSNHEPKSRVDVAKCG